MICGDCGWTGLTADWKAGCRGFPCELGPTKARETASPASEDVVLDLRISAFDQMAEAAGESNWIPPEYMANDWIADCCHLLRTGEGLASPAPRDRLEDGAAIQVIAQVLWEKVGPAITAARAADIARDIFAALTNTQAVGGE
jgi:hypothetical protein